jgi:hypothetical protein
MIIRQIMNRVIRKGIDSGMNAVANNHHRAKSTTSATPQGAITAANGQNLSVI